MGRVPTGCEPEMVEKAMNRAQVKQQQLLRPLLPPYRGTAEECLELLLQRLRENDLGADDRLFNWYDDENVGDVARTKELLSKCIWFKMHQQPEGTNTIAEALTLIREWKPWNQNELFNMYQTLQKAVEGGHLEMVEWLLDTWGVDPSPPSNYRWSGEGLGDHALGPRILDEFESSLSKNKEEEKGGKKMKDEKRANDFWMKSNSSTSGMASRLRLSQLSKLRSRASDGRH